MVLRCLLLRRFYELPAWADERLEHAGREELESWAEGVLDARRLEDVFRANCPPTLGVGRLPPFWVSHRDLEVSALYPEFEFVREALAQFA